MRVASLPHGHVYVEHLSDPGAVQPVHRLPDPARFDPSPEDEAELRERLLKAGEQRAS